MTKRNLLTSVAASTVLAGVLMLSGCGGSSNSDDNINGVETATGYQDIKSADANGKLTETITFTVEGKDSSGNVKSTSTISIPADTIISGVNDTPTCTKTAPCAISAVQKCATAVSSCTTTEVKDTIPSVPGVGTGEVAIFAGTLDITSAEIVDGVFKVTISVPLCGLPKGGEHVVGIPGCSVLKLWVTDKCGNNGKWIESEVPNPDWCGEREVTISLNSLPAHIVMFAVTPEYTGVTGGTGGSGY